MKQLICISDAIWRTNPGRTQELISRLRGVEILYFEPPVTILARFLGKAGRRRIRAHRQPGRRLMAHLTVYALPPIFPFAHRFSWIAKLNQRKLAVYIEKKMRKHGFDRPTLWISTEAGAGLSEHLPFENLVYDCTTPSPGFRLSRAEQSLLNEADLVFADQPNVVQQLSFLHPNVALIPDGVSYSRFSDLEENMLSFPKDMLAIPHPVFGCSEPIRQDTDLLPILFAARTHPEWSFVFTGRVDPRPQVALKKLSNAYLIVPKPQTDLAEYVRRFDVCISPLSSESETESTRIRMLEYLSTGRPVVNCLHPGETQPYLDAMYGAYTPQEFVDACQAALEEENPVLTRYRQEYAKAVDWELQASEAIRLLRVNGIL